MGEFLDALEDRVLVFDGGFGTFIEKYNDTVGLPDEAFLEGNKKKRCNDYLNILVPDVIADIHRGYFKAGADVAETNTFGANRIKLDEFGLGDKTYQVNFEAAQLARKVANEFSDEKPRYVAGSLGPTGTFPSYGDISFDELRNVYREAASGLIDGGVDAIIIETSMDLLELKAEVLGVNDYKKESGKDVAVMAQVFIDPQTNKMIQGTGIEAFETTIGALDVDILGLNCGAGPDFMRDSIKYLGKNTNKLISCIPNAGLPERADDGSALYTFDRDNFATLLKEYVVKYGVNIVGGCCGTDPDYIGRIVKAVSGTKSKKRKNKYVGRISSLYQSVDIQQEPKPAIIGERVNVTGSLQMKKMVDAGNLEGILDVAKGQADWGAHFLDVCTAHQEEDLERERMVQIVGELSKNAKMPPLIIDTRSYSVLEAAVKRYPGRTIINSINLEKGVEHVGPTLKLAREYGCALVAMTIDEDGQKYTSTGKFEVAKRIYNFLVDEWGFQPEDIIFDPLTFPITSGQEDLRTAGIETLEAIRLIKQEIPNVKTSIGLSNLSFGINKMPEARKVLNSVFAYDAVNSFGLDMAIMNPAHVVPYTKIPEEEKKLAEALIYNFGKDPAPLKNFSDYFTGRTSKEEKKVSLVHSLETVEEKLHYLILNQEKEGLESFLDGALDKYSAPDVIAQVLLPAMGEVGDKMGTGELMLFSVLESAGVMRKSLKYLEPHLAKAGDSYIKGTVVACTVEGDIHDIGKNLFVTIASNNGYNVIDLGNRVPASKIVETAIKENACAIGLSALLVETSRNMRDTPEELARREHHIPVLVGGAAIQPKVMRGIFGDFIDQNSGVTYCRTVFDGLNNLNEITGGKNEK